MRRRTFIAGAAAGIAAPALAQTATMTTETTMTPTAPATGYVEVNGLSMYYESHGEGGVPLVLLHGAFSSIHNSFGMLIPDLAKSRQVIGFDLQGHGRTADIDRSMTVANLAEDVVAALDALGIDRVDLWGYSNGAGVALHVITKRPERVRKLVFQSASYRLDGIHPGIMDNVGSMQPSMMYETPWYQEYQALNPKPDFDALFWKKTEADKQIKDFPDDDIAAIGQPVLIIAGDSDLPTIEHLARMFRLLGGGVFGDTPAGLPRSQLAILPGTSHITAAYRPDLLLPIVPAFLDRYEQPAA